MPNTTRFADCCGLRISYAFWGKGSPKADEKMYFDQTKEKAYLEAQCPMNTVIVLRHDQREHLLPSLAKGGWRMIHEFFNPNHGTILYMYFRDVVPEKAPGNPAFRQDKYEYEDFGYYNGLGKTRTLKRKSV